jgi:Zn-dependent protease with chaperone function
MFYLLATALSLAVFFLVLATASLLCIPGMRVLLKMAGQATPRMKANLLFAWRLLPPGLACAVTFSLALPAFLEFEPYSTKEGMGFRLAALAALGALVLLGMAMRAVIILRTTRKAQKGWRGHSERMEIAGMRAAVYRVENGASLLAVTGIFRPAIFVAREITEALSDDELRAALAHEMAHVLSFDNLKQLLLKITRVPRWLEAVYNSDAEWTRASELAADYRALQGGASALELSSALIKVGRLKRPPAGRESLASHLAPNACSGSLESRLVRLREILEGAETAPARARSGSYLLPMIISLAAYLACIHAVLPAVHEALEFLVR